MSLQSLESERQSILRRMQMSRSGYRHMLMEDTASDHDKPAAHYAEEARALAMPQEEARQFPRSVTMRLITRHPFALALAVTALVVIGPRRIMRFAARGSTTATAMSLRNRDNIDLVSRLLALAVQTMQRMRR